MPDFEIQTSTPGDVPGAKPPEEPRHRGLGQEPVLQAPSDAPVISPGPAVTVSLHSQIITPFFAAAMLRVHQYRVLRAIENYEFPFVWDFIPPGAAFHSYRILTASVAAIMGSCSRPPQNYDAAEALIVPERPLRRLRHPDRQAHLQEFAFK